MARMPAIIAVDAGIIELEAIHKGSGHAGGDSRLDIDAVGVENGLPLGVDGACHGVKRCVLLPGAGNCQWPGGSLRTAADIGHQSGNVGQCAFGLGQHGKASRFRKLPV
jgi:hypothetical protein